MMNISSDVLKEKILEDQYQQAKEVFKKQTLDIGKRNNEALGLLISGIGRSHEKSMYFFYKIVTSDPNLEWSQETLLNAYEYLGRAAIKGHLKALRVLEELENKPCPDLSKGIKGCLRFYQGLINNQKAERALLKARKFYKAAIKNKYQPDNKELTSLYKDVETEISHPIDGREKKRRRISDESTITTTSSLTDSHYSNSTPDVSMQESVPFEEQNPLSEKTEPPSGENVFSLLQRGLSNINNYKETKDRQKLELAIQDFSKGWENYQNFECYYQWGLSLLESEEENFRLQGVEKLIKIAAEYSPNVWPYLGQLFEGGHKVGKDIEKAKEYYRNGIKEHCFSDPPTKLFKQVLDDFYNESYHTAMDELAKNNCFAAAQIFYQLCDRGHLPSKFQYAKSLLYGRGCHPDPDVAISLLYEMIDDQKKIDPKLFREVKELIDSTLGTHGMQNILTFRNVDS